MNRWIQIFRRAKNRTAAGVAHIDRMVPAGDLEEPALFLDRILVIDAAGRNSKDDVIVVKAFSRTVTV